ncbi:hypothetical protein ACJU26_01290 [Acidithiobacillus sp. M4-SHS-6]|uniref:hypothetical protein n=1 Tax=Acidithiobacillus sp. M4-SHS-6 TaxID=3383024 RepID=UPI0039BDE6EE
MTPSNESTIKHHAIALFRELGYAYAFGPDGNHPERAGLDALATAPRECADE